MVRRFFTKRRIQYLLGGLLVALIFFVAAGGVSAIAWLTRSGLEQRAAERLAPLTGGEVTFGKVRFFSGQRLLLATDGKIGMADGTSVTFRRMEMTLRLAPLLVGTVRIDRFYLLDPVVTLPEKSDPAEEGASSLDAVSDARLAPSRIAIPMVTVALSAIHIENGRIEGPGLVAGGLDLKGVGEIGPRGLAFSLALTSGADAPLPIGKGGGEPPSTPSSPWSSAPG